MRHSINGTRNVHVWKSELNGPISNVRKSLFININQPDALNFIISLFQASTCFEHMCSSSGGQKLYYTTSGIITPIGAMIPETV